LSYKTYRAASWKESKCLHVDAQEALQGLVKGEQRVMARDQESTITKRMR